MGFLAQKIANKPFTIVGSGSQTRDFTYVSDIVSAFVRPLNQNKNEIFNVGSGATISINKIVDLLEVLKYILKKDLENQIALLQI